MEYFVGDYLLLGFKTLFEVKKAVVEFGEVELGHFAYVETVDFKGKAFGFEPVTVTFGAGDGVHEGVGPFLQGRGAFVGGHLHDVVDDALEAGAVVHFVCVLHASEVAGAVEDGVHGIFGEGLDGVVDGEMVVAPQVFQLAVEIVGGAVFAQNLEGTLTDAFGRVGDEFGDVDLCYLSKTVAFGAGAVGGVEGEGVGFGFGIGDSGDGVHEEAAVVGGLGFGRGNGGGRLVFEYHEHPFALFEGSADSLFEPVGIVAYAHTVDYQLDVVGFVAVDLHVVGQFADFAVDTHTQEPFLGYLGKEFAVVAFACFYKGGQNHDVFPLIFVGDEVEDMLFGVFHHALAADVGVGDAYAGVEETDKIVYLGDGAYRGAGIFVGGFLLDGDDGAETVDAVDIGTLDVADKVTCVGREGLHVAPLAFGMDGVESQTGFAAAAKACENHKLVARNVDVDVLQVVFACS